MATASIISQGAITSGARVKGTSAEEGRLYMDPESLRKTEYTVYIHTISRRSFMQPNGIYRNIMVPACPKEKRSLCFWRQQHPVRTDHLNPDDVNGLPLTKFENAKRVALGICNPDYAGTDLSIQDKELNPETVLASGECNLTRQGIWASMNEEPTEEEIKKAEARRKTYYLFRIQEADGLERSNPRQCSSNFFNSTTTWRLSMFDLEANWHRALR